jgi:ISXO2-like transposase domain
LNPWDAPRRPLVTKDAGEALAYEIVSETVDLLATNETTVRNGLTESNHRKQYVVGAVHTNTIEGFWSTFKRGEVGTFHKMSARYMPLYVAEFQFRYNNRGNPEILGTKIGGCC